MWRAEPPSSTPSSRKYPFIEKVKSGTNPFVFSFMEKVISEIPQRVRVRIREWVFPFPCLWWSDSVCLSVRVWKSDNVKECEREPSTPCVWRSVRVRPPLCVPWEGEWEFCLALFVCPWMRVFSHLFKKVGMNVPSFLCETMRISLPSPSVCECKLAVLPLCETRKVKAGVRECVYSPLRVSVYKWKLACCRICKWEGASLSLRVRESESECVWPSVR